MLVIVLVLACVAGHLTAARLTRSAWGLAGDDDWNSAKTVICLFLWPFVLGGLYVSEPCRDKWSQFEVELDAVETRLGRSQDKNNALRLEVSQLKRQLELALPPRPPGDTPYRRPDPTSTPGGGS